jgi:hypothetical protein
VIGMDYDELRRRLKKDLNEKSDRACVVAVGAWIDTVLALAIEQADPPVAKPPHSLAKRIDWALATKRIDHELATDLHIVRVMRNDFAHSVDFSSLHDSTLQAKIDSLRVPARVYSDWGELRAAATASGGVILYTGSRPPEAGEALFVGSFTFKMALEVILAVLLGSLELTVRVDAATVGRFHLGESLQADAPSQ